MLISKKDIFCSAAATAYCAGCFLSMSGLVFVAEIVPWQPELLHGV